MTGYSYLLDPVERRQFGGPVALSGSVGSVAINAHVVDGHAAAEVVDLKIGD